MTSTHVRSAPSRLVLPPGFEFGAATAAYQIEGAFDVDGRGPSIWDTYSHTPGKTFNGDTGDVAVEHYTRYPQDVALMKDLGLDTYRFSVSWPRILPAGKGAVEQRGLDFYRRLVDTILEAGIAPWLTLYHWDLPQALEDEDGWANRDTAKHFADYAGIVYDALGDRVPHWSTLNEPMCSSLLGYNADAHAPGRTDPAAAAKAVHHLLLGHGLATQALRAKGADHLGITLNFTPMYAASDSEVDVDAARRQDGQMNRMFITPIVTGEYPADVVEDLARVGAPLPVQDGDLEVIATPIDWLGINYYYAAVVSGGHEPQLPTTFIGCEDVREEAQDGPTTTMGWSLNPDSFTELLGRITEIAPGLPLYITENGSAWPDEVAEDGVVHDQQRVDYLHSHLAAMATAIEAGADVRGYFAWSLLDNYEWARGYAQRFGIVHVDYDTQVRTPKDSAHAYAEVIGAHKRQHEAGA